MGAFLSTTEIPLKRDNSSNFKTAEFVFPIAIFLSAFLMFNLQPMFAKMLTPLMGGSASVWNTALVFYQTMLLLGYLYAHLLNKFFNRNMQILIHGAILGLSLFFMPVQVSQMAGGPSFNNPILWTLGALTLSIGLPIFAISATAPLVQSWHARFGEDANPYALYAASNLGSFIALILYPTIIETFIGVRFQAIAWGVLFAALALLLILCLNLSPEKNETQSAIEKTKLNWKDRLIWLVYALVPSGLLVAVTTEIVTDVASVPFLWLPPLALYLLTFVIAFSKYGELIADGSVFMKLLMVFLIAILIATDTDSGILGIVFHLSTFFLIVLGCHLELVKRLPPRDHLTEFYFFMSLGGAIGGLLAAMVAPNVFNTTIEYQLLLISALLIAPLQTDGARRGLLFLVIIFLFSMWFSGRDVFGVILEAKIPIQSDQYFWQNLLLSVDDDKAALILTIVMLLIAIFNYKNTIVVVAAGAMTLLLPALDRDYQDIRFQGRNFFGLIKLEDSGKAPDGWRFLSHGTTLHGVMSLDPSRNRTPMSYYWHETPIGTIFADMTENRPQMNAGVIGLGMGSTMCYAKPGQDWRIFEINPMVINIALNDKLVGFVPRCAPQARIFEGDARIEIAKQADNWFDVLLVDAFSSDSIPTHMLTKEAIALMMKKMKPDGIMIVHISNRNLELTNIVADAAFANGFAAMQGIRNGNPANPNADTGVSAIILARNETLLAKYNGPMWKHLGMVKNPKPWTDDHTDVIRAVLDHH